MKRELQRGAAEGVAFGLIAGLTFAMMEVGGAVMMGNPWLMPFRMFASVVLGEAGLEATPAGTALAIGLGAHLVLSAGFGLVYGLVNSRLSAQSQTDWIRQAAIGLIFGAVLWLVNFQVIARLLYPWFLESPQMLQLLMHAMFFGLPLGLLYAGSERRVRGISRHPTTA